MDALSRKQLLGAHLGERDQDPLPSTMLRLAKLEKKKKKAVVLNPIMDNNQQQIDPGKSLFASLVVNMVGGQTLHANNKQRGEDPSNKKNSTKLTIYDKLAGGTVHRQQGRGLQRLSGMEDFFNNTTGTMSMSNSNSFLGAIPNSTSSSFDINGTERSRGKRRPGSSGAAPLVTVHDLAPLHMFPDKHDTLVGAFFAADKSANPNILEEEKHLQFKKPARRIDQGHTDGSLDGVPLQFDVTTAEKHSKWYRWRNEDFTPTIAAPQPSKHYVLVEESKLKNLSEFELRMSQEQKAIEFVHDGQIIKHRVETSATRASTAPDLNMPDSPGLGQDERKDHRDGTLLDDENSEKEKVSLRSLIRKRSDSDDLDALDGDEYSNTSSALKSTATRSPHGKHSNVLNHNMMDPRVPTPKIAHALKSLSDNQFRILLKDWNALQATWHDHVKKHHYNKAFLFREYTESKVASATHEQEGAKEWLLKVAPIEDRVRKLKYAEGALKSFLRRHERDSMLYEDDRSFLYNKMYEARDRSVDYERYVFLCGMFGPMSVKDWEKCGARPGLAYWVRATAAALKIQHKWDQYWSTYKLRRYRAARWIQTLWRKHYCLVNIAPLIRIRLRFGKRTYYYYCWASWNRYNYMVRNIRRLLLFHKYNWSRKTMASWKQFVLIRTAEKKEIMRKFKKRFDVRSEKFHRLHAYATRSRYLKCLLRNYYYIPQFKMWVEYTKNNKLRRKLGRVLVPLQAFVRMRQQKAHYHKLIKSKRIMVRFCKLLRSICRVKSKREEHIDQRLIEWKPAELIRRADTKDELERRRQLREIQLAEEKCVEAIAAMQKHFRSWSTNGATQIRDELRMNIAGECLGSLKPDPSIISYKQMEYALLRRCYIATYEESKFEYRIKKPPLFVCADPLCGKMFSSNEQYIEHVEAMMKNPNKCTKGIMKKDIQAGIAERGLQKLGIEPVRFKKDKAKEKRENKILASGATSTSEVTPLLADANAVDPDAPIEPPKKSAVEKLREKKAVEKEQADAKAKAEKAATDRAEQEKKDKKRKKKEASKMSTKQKRKAGLTDENMEDTVETETETVARLFTEALAAEKTRLEEEEKARVAKAEEERLLAEVAAEEERAKKEKQIRDELAEIEKANATPIHVGIRKHMVFPNFNFGRFHIILKQTQGFHALRTYLTRKHGTSPILNTLDCWDAIQMWRLGSVYSQNDAYVQRALAIYESFLRADCERPLMINMADGNILNNHYAKVASIAALALEKTKKKSLKMLVKRQQSMARLEKELEENKANQKEGLADYDWWDALIDRLVDVKNRDFVGWFGQRRAGKNCVRSVLGLRGKQYQSWSECRTVSPDIFDALEWACFQMIYKAVFSYDKTTPEDISRENEMERLQLIQNKKEQKERDLKEEKIDMKWDARWIRLARETCVLCAYKMRRRQRVLQQALDECLDADGIPMGQRRNDDESDWLDDDSTLVPGDPGWLIREEAIQEAAPGIVKAFMNSSQLADHIINSVLAKLMQEEYKACSELPGTGGYTAPHIMTLEPVPYVEPVFHGSSSIVDDGSVVSLDGGLDAGGSVVSAMSESITRVPSSPGLGLVSTSSAKKPAAAVPPKEKEAEYDPINLFEIPFVAIVIKQFNLTKNLKPIGKSRASIRVNTQAAAWQIEKDLLHAPFMHSREFSVYQEVLKAEQSRAAAAFRLDCKESRVGTIQEWAKSFKIDENNISLIAMQAANIVLDKQIDRLVNRAAKVTVKERVMVIREKEQGPWEANALLNNDAVAWTEENELDHLFDHYVVWMLNTMLGMEECREGLLEYGGFLRGQKQMKKKLEVQVTQAGRRVDDSWFKSMIKEAISEDLKHLPLDYMGAVRMVQRRFRGMRGRNVGRRVFAKYWLKKFDPSENKVYYVNGKTDPPTVQWVRPSFMLHLFPKTSW